MADLLSQLHGFTASQRHSVTASRLHDEHGSPVQRIEPQPQPPCQAILHRRPIDNVHQSQRQTQKQSRRFRNGVTPHRSLNAFRNAMVAAYPMLQHALRWVRPSHAHEAWQSTSQINALPRQQPRATYQAYRAYQIHAKTCQTRQTRQTRHERHQRHSPSGVADGLPRHAATVADSPAV
ncbi:hypothetical protein E4U54_005778 [Claviceps lovelessii]|nr:hypothetical protein E4U54_005778 [Claviceps lovelessii]